MFVSFPYSRRTVMVDFYEQQQFIWGIFSAFNMLKKTF